MKTKFKFIGGPLDGCGGDFECEGEPTCDGMIIPFKDVNYKLDFLTLTADLCVIGPDDGEKILRDHNAENLTGSDILKFLQRDG
jgi:hypothetical protein